MSVSGTMVAHMLELVDGEARAAVLRVAFPDIDELAARVTAEPETILALPAKTARAVAEPLDDDARDAAERVELRGSVRAALAAPRTSPEPLSAFPGDVDGWMTVLEEGCGQDLFVAAYRWATSRPAAERNQVVAGIAKQATALHWDGLGLLAADILDGVEPAITLAELKTEHRYVEGFLAAAYLRRNGHVDARAARWLARMDVGDAAGLCSQTAEPPAVTRWKPGSPRSRCRRPVPQLRSCCARRARCLPPSLPPTCSPARTTKRWPGCSPPLRRTPSRRW